MGASPGQKLLMTGSTFAATWGVVQHGGEGAIIAAVLASVVLSNADTIIDKFTGGHTSPQPADDDYPTEEEIAAYRLMQQQLGQGEPAVREDNPTEEEIAANPEIQRQVAQGTSNLPSQIRERNLDDDLARPKQRGPFVMSMVLRDFTPTLDKIYLGTLLNGKPIFCNSKELCHVALAGATDAGKSNIMRMLVMQLCSVGAKVLILNPHWTGYVLDKKEDWTPIIPYLHDDPMVCRKYETIDYYLDYLANTIVPTRLDRYAYSKPVGKPIFVVLDELPAIVKWGKKHNRDIPGYLDTILKEGRKVGVYLISAAQDFLVDTIGGTGAVRDCYRTAYSVGGDDTTTNKLLGKTKADRPLGKGIVLLRNASNDLCKEAIVALVPYVDNASLDLLGPSTYDPDEVDTEALEDSDLEVTRAQAVENKQRVSTATAIVPNVPDKGPKAADISINVLCAAWNGGINTVSKIETEFKMSHREAYKAYKLVKAQRGEPVEEQE